jgi:hypothetical protein
MRAGAGGAVTVVAYIAAARGDRASASDALRQVLKEHGMTESFMERASYIESAGRVIAEIPLTADEVPPGFGLGFGAGVHPKRRPKQIAVRCPLS